MTFCQEYASSSLAGTPIGRRTGRGNPENNQDEKNHTAGTEEKARRQTRPWL